MTKAPSPSLTLRVQGHVAGVLAGVVVAQSSTRTGRAPSLEGKAPHWGPSQLHTGPCWKARPRHTARIQNLAQIHLARHLLDHTPSHGCRTSLPEVHPIDPTPAPAGVPRLRRPLWAQVAKTKHFRAKESLCQGSSFVSSCTPAQSCASRTPSGATGPRWWAGVCESRRDSLRTWLPAEGRMPAGT